jgi:hypothetical protein
MRVRQQRIVIKLSASMSKIAIETKQTNKSIRLLGYVKNNESLTARTTAKMQWLMFC